ncbi:MAG: hypothetical protein UR93_C0034G0003 [Berkelbacteria bacterium GW2011_GWA2_35_9]|uniref:Glycosyltransferase RgtA/B/C/D-like domain-containing protein n=1 Tax=Berkelbacteria bacterium GW2011_GWA2_35_9 TaxID=1618333 RepID=A0A0G0DG42_9BACT|nr:MAG: hypothetical protein UR93_C0034G0003 [Berkelbacteria bacterium GW2011_GWA2_35_9]
MSKIKALLSNKIINYGLIVFLLALLIRAIPEIMMGKFPIGYDTTTSYLTVISDILHKNINYFTTEQILGHNGLYIIYQVLINLGLSEPLILIKLVSIAMFSLLVISFYCLATKGFHYSPKNSLLVTILFMTSIVAVRISSDLVRNELGLIFFNLYLATLLNLNRRMWLGKIFLLAILVILTYIAHQTVFVLLVLASAICLLVEIAKYFNQYLAVLFYASFIALILVLPVVFNYEWSNIDLFETVTQSQLFLVYQPVLLYGIIYFTFIPFILLATLRLDSSKKSIVIMSLLFVSLSLIALLPLIYFPVLPQFWDRWLFMLIIPVTILAYEGIKYFSTRLSKEKTVSSALAVILIIMINFQFFPYTFTKSGIESFIPNYASLPHTFLWSSVGRERLSELEIVYKKISSLEKDDYLVMDGRYRGYYSYYNYEQKKKNEPQIIETTGAHTIDKNMINSLLQNGAKVYVFDKNEILDIYSSADVLTTAYGYSIKELIYDSQKSS